MSELTIKLIKRAGRFKALKDKNESLTALLKEKQAEIDEVDLRCAKLEGQLERHQSAIKFTSDDACNLLAMTSDCYGSDDVELMEIDLKNLEIILSNKLNEEVDNNTE